MTGVDESIPLYSEEARVSKKTVEHGRVHVRIQTHVDQSIVRENLSFENVTVERVPIGRVVEAAPAVRQDGDVLIYPVLEERLVKQLVLVEELRVTRTHGTQVFEEATSLRRQDVVIERTSLDTSSST